MCELVKNKGIVFEMCPTSNRQTHAVENMKDYPFIKYLNEGIKVTLNTDDMAIILNNAVDAAFTSAAVKEELKKELGLAK